MKRIFLVGYMCAGKTTIGSELALKLGYRFIDLDLYIEQKQGKSISTTSKR
jgi:shikimate kinase